MTKHELLIDLLDSMDIDSLVPIWNEYQRDIGYEDEVYYMSEIDDLFYGCSVSDFLEKLDDFHYRDDFFYFTIYGIESTDNPKDEPIYLDELADWLEETENNCYDSDLSDLFESDEYIEAA